MIFETWFIFAVISAFSGGIMSFLYKVAAKEKVDIVLLSFWTSVVGVITLTLITFIYSDFSNFWHPMLLFAAITSGTFLMTNILKVKSLENIDAAIFFPLYKVFGPAIVIILGIIIFNEAFTVYEWVGLIVSLMIPLLLISKAEDQRQINLKMGLFWLGVTVIVASISAAAWKHGADITLNTWAYILAVDLTGMFAAMFTLFKKYGVRSTKKFVVLKDKMFIKMLAAAGAANVISGSLFVFAFTSGGSLGIVYTINSLYILIPIVLAIIVYKEHWNLRKAAAIVLSIVALAFFA